MQVAGFVLVGGSSSRMGRDKARLPIGTHLLVEDVAAKVKAVASNVMLVGQQDRYSDLQVECLPDLRPGLGPLAGIEAALFSGRGEHNLIVGCDMPGLDPMWLERLVNAAKKRGARCIVSRDETGALHPLCAIYHQACLPDIRAALDARHLRLLDVIQGLHADFMDIERTILNINNPSQWVDWQTRSGIGLTESKSV